MSKSPGLIKFFIGSKLITPAVLGIFLAANLIWANSLFNHRQIQGVTTDLTPEKILELTNLVRTQNKLPTLSLNQQLSQAAQSKAQNMIATGHFDHFYNTASGEVTPWQYILDSGYQYSFAGENLGRNFTSAEDLIQAWMDSAPHRKNILDDHYTDIGIAVTQGSFPDQANTFLVVQLLAAPISAAAISGSYQDRFFPTPMINAQTLINQLLHNYPPALFGFGLAVLLYVALKLTLTSNHKKPRHRRPSAKLWSH